MSTKAVMWTLAGGLLLATAVKAEPLEDLRTRLTALRSNQPIRLLVDVELERRGSAPLHLQATRLKGQATIVSGPKGVKSIKQKWLSTKTDLSLWTAGNHSKPSELRLLDDAEAEALVNPVDTLDVLLANATVLSEREADWQGRPAHLMVIRPALFAKKGKDPGPLAGEISIWLDENGDPLALESSAEIGVPGLSVTRYQIFTFQQIDGRLLVADMSERFQGSALVLRGKETRTMTVSADRRADASR